MISWPYSKRQRRAAKTLIFLESGDGYLAEDTVITC